MKSRKKQIFIVIWAFVLMLLVRPGFAETGTCGVNVSYTVSNTDARKSMTFTAAGSDAEWDENCFTAIQNYSPKTVNVIMNDGGQKIRLDSSDHILSDGQKNTYTEEADLTGFDVSSASSMNMLFNNCTALKSLDLSGWDTGNVTKMDQMFKGCSALTGLDLSGWDASALDPSISGNYDVFTNCNSLAALTLGLNTDKGNILQTIPVSSQNWYYIAQCQAPGNPLDYGSALSDAELFSGYAPDRMAGLWVLDENYLSGQNTLTLPIGFTLIGPSAFEGLSSVNTVVLPEGLTSVGSRAFAGCADLRLVCFSSAAAEIDPDAFADIPLLVISGPQGSSAVTFAQQQNIPYRVE